MISFKCDYCKKEYGDGLLYTEEECKAMSKPVGKRITGLGLICFNCLENNPGVPKVNQTLLDTSETIYVVP